jgi:peptidoglycan hydrolase CwlO-like protein
MVSGGTWNSASANTITGDSEVAKLKQRAQSGATRIQDGNQDVSNVTAEIEETRSRIGEMKIRMRGLDGQIGDVESQLEDRSADLAEDREDYEDLARDVYKDGLQDEDTDADSSSQSGLLEALERIEQLEDDRQSLENSIRQLEQKKEDYEALIQNERSAISSLVNQRGEIEDDTFSTKRNQNGIRNRIEQRPKKLEAMERAKERKKAKILRRAGRKNDDHAKLRGPIPGVEKASNREREMEIAKKLVVTEEARVPEPVEPISREEYDRLYKQAAADYGFGEDWYVLSAIGQVESNHGENLGPSSAGALGPMQFLPSTWITAGVDGDGDGEKNIMDPEDAIPAAAGYLRSGGAPGDWTAALYTYNHSSSYVLEVLTIAESLRKQAGDTNPGPYIDNSHQSNPSTDNERENAENSPSVDEKSETTRLSGSEDIVKSEIRARWHQNPLLRDK